MITVQKQCHECPRMVTYRFNDNGIILDVDGDEGVIHSEDLMRFTTACHPVQHETFYDVVQYEPLFTMCSFILDYTPNDTVYGYLCTDRNGRVSAVSTF